MFPNWNINFPGTPPTLNAARPRSVDQVLSFGEFIIDTGPVYFTSHVAPWHPVNQTPGLGARPRNFSLA